MSNGNTENQDQRGGKVHYAIGILKTQIEQLKRVETVLQIQLLQNCDQVEYELKKVNLGAIASIVDYMIKGPFRRIVGKIKLSRQSLEECLKNLETEME